MDGLTILLAMSGYLAGLVFLTGQHRQFTKRLREKDERLADYRAEISRLYGERTHLLAGYRVEKKGAAA